MIYLIFSEPWNTNTYKRRDLTWPLPDSAPQSRLPTCSPLRRPRLSNHRHAGLTARTTSTNSSESHSRFCNGKSLNNPWSYANKKSPTDMRRESTERCFSERQLTQLRHSAMLYVTQNASNTHHLQKGLLRGTSAHLGRDNFFFFKETAI